MEKNVEHVRGRHTAPRDLPERGRGKVAKIKEVYWASGSREKQLGAVPAIFRPWAPFTLLSHGMT